MWPYKKQTPEMVIHKIGANDILNFIQNYEKSVALHFAKTFSQKITVTVFLQTTEYK